jgi:hypothetical protein
MKAYPLKGEVRFKVGGEDGDEFVLAYPINSIIAAEKHFGVKFEKILARFLTSGADDAEADDAEAADDDRPRPMSREEMRTLIRFALDARQPGITDEDAGELIGAVGEAELGRMIGECLVATFGLKVGEAGGEADGPPAPRPAGTGKTATEPGDASALDLSTST